MSVNFHIHCSTNVLMLNFDAGWDHQPQIRKLSQAIRERSKIFTNQPWAIIDDIRRWPIKSPQEIALCTDLSIELMEKGMTHCAVCINDVAVSKWMMEKIVPKDVELAFFKQPQECKTWLSAQGFDTEFGLPVKTEVSSDM